MKKRIVFLLIMCLSIGLMGCNQTDPKNTEPSQQESSENATDSKQDASEEDGARIIDLTKQECLTLDMEALTELQSDFVVSEEVIEIEKDGAIESTILADRKLFFTIEYVAFYDAYLQEGKEPPAFIESHNTKICAYDLDTKETNIVYQYQEDYAVDTYDLYYKDGCLIWAEPTNEELEWQLRENTLNLSDKTLTYELYDEMLYEDVEEESAAPVIEGVTTSYRQGNNWSKITIETADKVTELSVNGLITDAVSDGRICVWRNSNADENLRIYDMVNDVYYGLKVDYNSLKSVTMYEQWLFMKMSDTLYAFNIVENSYDVILENCYGSIYFEEDGLYTLLRGDELKLVNCTLDSGQ